MDVTELMQTLDSVLPSASGRMTFVVTEIGGGTIALERLLDGALGAARRHGVPLTEVQLDMARFPEMGASYWHVPVVESGRPGIVRLVFEASPRAAELAALSVTRQATQPVAPA